MSLTALVLVSALVALEQEKPAPAADTAARVKVFDDCSDFGCYDEYLREEIDFVEYVRDRSDADVHVLVTSAQTGARGREYTLTFIGQGRFAATTRSLKFTTEASDSDDRIRRGLGTALTVGLLSYIAPESIPVGLRVEAQLASGVVQAGSADNDSWNRWIFSLNGSAALEAEESTRDRNWGLSFGADRITPTWKISLLRGNPLRQAGRDTCGTRGVNHLRTARAVGHLAGPGRMVELLPRALDESRECRRRGRSEDRARIVSVNGGFRIQDPRSVVSPQTQRDA